MWQFPWWCWRTHCWLRPPDRSRDLYAAATGFADDKDIPDWAKGAVAAMKKLGIIEGKGANAFAPSDKTTRAEAVTVLLKMLAHKGK